MFPTIQGENLEKRKFVLPSDLEGEKNILLVAFQRWHQALVDSWTGPLANLVADRSDVYIYELPILPQINPIGRFFIDNGMRAGIPSRKVREMTITVYTDLDDFARKLNIENFDTIVPMVVTREGEILWRGLAGYDEQQFNQLGQVLG